MTIDRIHTILDDLGVSKHLDGYDAISLVTLHQANNSHIGICESYKYAASQLNRSKGSVERNIRYTIVWVTNNISKKNLIKYFGNCIPKDNHITNKQFIITLALTAKRGTEDEEWL